MLPAGFKLAIPGGEQLQTQALNRATSGIGPSVLSLSLINLRQSVVYTRCLIKISVEYLEDRKD
jgi:hypothetical protein